MNSERFALRVPEWLKIDHLQPSIMACNLFRAYFRSSIAEKRTTLSQKGDSQARGVLHGVDRLATGVHIFWISTMGLAWIRLKFGQNLSILLQIARMGPSGKEVFHQRFFESLRDEKLSLEVSAQPFCVHSSAVSLVVFVSVVLSSFRLFLFPVSLSSAAGRGCTIHQDPFCWEY